MAGMFGEVVGVFGEFLAMFGSSPLVYIVAVGVVGFAVRGIFGVLRGGGNGA